MLRRRVFLLAVLAIVLVGVLCEFGVASPWHHEIRDAYAAYSLRKLRSNWQPPCRSDDWAPVKLDGHVVPVPSCLEYVINPPMVEGHGSMLVAQDSMSVGFYLILSVRDASAEWTVAIRAIEDRPYCSVLREGEPFVWTCSFDTLNVVHNGKWFTASAATPDYLAVATRRRELEIATEVIDEFLRMQDGSLEPGAS